MKNFLLLLASFLILICADTSAQEEKKENAHLHWLNLNIPDIYPEDNFDLYRPDLSQQPAADSLNPKLLLAYMLSGEIKDNFWKGDNGFDFLSNYHEFYMESTKFNPVRMILGMAEAGAVGYLAYQHIKKYGLK